MLTVASLAVLVTMMIALARATLGPTAYDRILAVNVFGTKTVLMIALLGYLDDRPDFLDIAIVYALINFISMVAVAKYVDFIINPSQRSPNHDGDTPP